MAGEGAYISGSLESSGVKTAGGAAQRFFFVSRSFGMFLKAFEGGRGDGEGGGMPFPLRTNTIDMPEEHRKHY